MNAGTVLAGAGPVAIVGAGRMGGALAIALQSAGQAVSTVASRSAASAEMLARRLGARATDAQAAVDAARLVIVSTPDDAIEPLVSSLRWSPRQTVLHCSGASELSVLAAAESQGAAVGGFHPLQLIAQAVQGAASLRGSRVALESRPGDVATATLLLQLADCLGMVPLQLPPGGRARYHAAANLAASGLLAVLDEACRLFGSLGLTQDLALSALLPLSRGALEAAAARGLPAAVSGPVARGDVAVLARHLHALAEAGGDSLALYRALARRQLDLAQRAGRLEPEQLSLMRTLLAQEAEGIASFIAPIDASNP